MATEFSAYSIKRTFVAGADLSASQFCFVNLDGTTGKVVAASATTDRPIGVLQNTASTDQAAEVLIAGGTKIKLGGGASAGNPLFVSASGTAVTATVGSAASTFYILGTFVESGASGAIGSAVINCSNPARGG